MNGDLVYLLLVAIRSSVVSLKILIHVSTFFALAFEFVMRSRTTGAMCFLHIALSIVHLWPDSMSTKRPI